MKLIEPPLHRPHPCPGCGEPSTAIVDDRCLTCRTDPADIPRCAPTASCEGCRQPLLLNRPGRTHCARCQLDAA